MGNGQTLCSKYSNRLSFTVGEKLFALLSCLNNIKTRQAEDIKSSLANGIKFGIPKSEISINIPAK